MVHGRWIDARGTRSLLAGVPASYRRAFDRAEAMLAFRPEGARRYLAAKRPPHWGRTPPLSPQGALMAAAEKRSPEELAAMLRRSSRGESRLAATPASQPLKRARLRVPRGERQNGLRRGSVPGHNGAVPEIRQHLRQPRRTYLALGDRDAARKAYARALEVRPTTRTRRRDEGLLETKLKLAASRRALSTLQPRAPPHPFSTTVTGASPLPPPGHPSPPPWSSPHHPRDAGGGGGQG
jgi:hypothetical protein